MEFEYDQLAWKKDNIKVGAYLSFNDAVHKAALVIEKREKTFLVNIFPKGQEYLISLGLLEKQSNHPHTRMFLRD